MPLLKTLCEVEVVDQELVVQAEELGIPAPAAELAIELVVLHPQHIVAAEKNREFPDEKTEVILSTGHSITVMVARDEFVEMWESALY